MVKWFVERVNETNNFQNTLIRGLMYSSAIIPVLRAEIEL